jgi:hypothetical protein
VSRRVLCCLLALVAVVVTGACEARAQVGVAVREDGSGTVTVTVRLDDEAARRLGDPATALSVDDLRQAGWQVEDPAPGDGGGLVLRVRRPFAGPADLPRVLDEVGGTDGVFRDVQLSLRDGFASTEYEFSAGVELSGNPEQFGDEVLTGTLGGLALARTPEELALEGAADPAAMVLEVAVQLPGGAPETNGEGRDGAAVWSFPVTGGEATSAELSSTSTVTSTGTRVWVLVGLVALVASMAMAVVGLLRRRA